MIDREIRDIMYLRFPSLMEEMRRQPGFRSLTVDYDALVNDWWLVRNCLLHNLGKADHRLATTHSNLNKGDMILLNMKDVHEATTIVGKLAYEVDKAFDGVS
jgi:hypothetical protein